MSGSGPRLKPPSVVDQKQPYRTEGAASFAMNALAVAPGAPGGSILLRASATSTCRAAAMVRLARLTPKIEIDRGSDVARGAVQETRDLHL